MEWTQLELSKGKLRLRECLNRAGLTAHAFLAPEPAKKTDEIRSIVVVLFPYFAGEAPGNLSYYCRGLDYHKVTARYLEAAAKALQAVLGEDLVYHAYADTGPLADRYLALRAGLGWIGKNQMLIHPVWGSYCFISYLTLNAPLEADAPAATAETTCMRCGRCVRSCPGGALTEDGAFRPERCRSSITQKTGELAPWEIQILQKDSLIFGCDVCQKVCPHNAGVPLTMIKEFREDLIASLSKADLQGVSRRQFAARYPDRAFTWRGPAVLRRNLELLLEEAGHGD